MGRTRAVTYFPLPSNTQGSSPACKEWVGSRGSEASSQCMQGQIGVCKLSDLGPTRRSEERILRATVQHESQVGCSRKRDSPRMEGGGNRLGHCKPGLRWVGPRGGDFFRILHLGRGIGGLTERV